MHADNKCVVHSLNVRNRDKRWHIGREKWRNLTIDQMKGLLWTVKMNFTMWSTPQILMSWVIEKIKVGVCHFGQGYWAC